MKALTTDSTDRFALRAFKPGDRVKRDALPPKKKEYSV